MLTRLVFLFSAIREHVHKNENHDPEGNVCIQEEHDHTDEEWHEDSSGILEKTTEETEMAVIGDIQHREVQLEAVHEKEMELDKVQTGEKESKEVQTESEGIQSGEGLSEDEPEEKEEEETVYEAGPELLRESETELISDEVTDCEKTIDNSERYNGECTGKEEAILYDMEEESLFSYAQTENYEIAMIEEVVYVLPETGGTGTRISGISGFLCILFAAILFLVRCKLAGKDTRSKTQIEYGHL